MTSVQERFNCRFARWDIRLPPDAVARREAGKIVQAGWAIWYQFGRDDEGEYLDYYASHRMTDDSHVRLRPSGVAEPLPAIQSWRRVSADPVEDLRLQEEFAARNREVSSILAAKGFGLRGDEPGGVLINRFLRERKDAK